MNRASNLKRLIYVSAQSPSTVADLDFTVGAIIRSSIRCNRETGLTGMLLTYQGHFIQVLEGAEMAVGHACGRILNDPRHCEATVISAERVVARGFSDWNMCARSLSASDAAILEVLDAREVLDLRKLTPRSALRLLTKVAEIQRRTALSAMVG